MTRRDLESPVQRSILEAIWFAAPDVMAYSIPNGGFLLAPRIVAKLKWLGLLPGMPDLGVVWTGGSGFIEVKSATGILSDDQKHVHAILREKGHRVAVCRSPVEALKALSEWGAPNNARVAA